MKLNTNPWYTMLTITTESIGEIVHNYSVARKKTRSPFPNMYGTQSIKLLRPKQSGIVNGTLCKGQIFITFSRRKGLQPQGNLVVPNIITISSS